MEKKYYHKNGGVSYCDIPAHFSFDFKKIIKAIKAIDWFPCIIIFSLFIAFLGMFLPIAYLFRPSFDTTKNEIFWGIIIIAVSSLYMIFAIRLGRRIKKEINQKIVA